MEIDIKNTGFGHFENPQYNPEDLLLIEKSYLNGCKYNIKTLRWGINNKLETETDALCETFDKFCETIWDLFSDILSKDALNYICPFGLKNSNPYRQIQYFYDGLTLSMNRKLFLDCINNQDIGHFYSFIKKCTNIQIEQV
jgi:hypothetical protein